MNFEFATATRIIFGRGKRNEAANAAAAHGEVGLVVTGANTERAKWLIEDLTRLGLRVELFSTEGEPTIETAETGAGRARNMWCTWVVAVGGGSAIDAGKAIAALATNSAPPEHYLEVIGQGQPLTSEPLPFIAIPTTAGTGAEVTRNAVLASPEAQVKVSLRSPKMLPRLAIVDSELADNLPREITASTGMDALTQLIEAFLCTRANPLTDALCRQSIPDVARALPKLCNGENSPERRDVMALGSLFSGLSLANAGLGAAHGFAAAIGGLSIAPHGAICAALLPIVVEVNYRACKRVAAPNLHRFDELAAMLAGSRAARAEDGIRRLHDLGRELKIEPLRTYGLNAAAAADICTRAAAASSMKANPAPLRTEELEEIFHRAI